MDEESIFRIIFVLTLVGNLAISTYFRRQARRSGDVIPRRSKGRLFLLLRGLVSIPLLTAAVVYAVNPDWMRWSLMPLPPWMRWLAGAVSLLTIPLFHWTFRSLGSNVTETILTKRRHQMVTHGPYRHIRHPLYTVGTVFWLATSVLAANGFMLAMAMFAAALLPPVVRCEEANLVAKFGERYRTYQAQTGRFLPKLRIAARRNKKRGSNVEPRCRT